MNMFATINHSRHALRLLLPAAVFSMLALSTLATGAALDEPATGKPSATQTKPKTSLRDSPLGKFIKGPRTTEDKPGTGKTKPESKPPVVRRPFTKPPATTTQKKDEPTLGVLRDIGRGVKMSSAGLRYTPGSREGHRLDHVKRHAEDAPSRPIHGVFDGGEAKMLATIDQAYLLIKQKSKQVKSKREGDRTVYEVDLGKRIGYIGGQSGKRQGKPACHHVRLVLEGNAVITAFPFRPYRR